MLWLWIGVGIVLGIIVGVVIAIVTKINENGANEDEEDEEDEGNETVTIPSFLESRSAVVSSLWEEGCLLSKSLQVTHVLCGWTRIYLGGTGKGTQWSLNRLEDMKISTVSGNEISLIALDGSSALPLWTLPIPLLMAMDVDDYDHVFHLSADGEVSSITQVDSAGIQVWKTSLTSYRDLRVNRGAVKVRQDGRFLVVSVQIGAGDPERAAGHSIWALNGDTGRVLWRTHVALVSPSNQCVLALSLTHIYWVGHTDPSTELQIDTVRPVLPESRQLLLAAWTHRGRVLWSASVVARIDGPISLTACHRDDHVSLSFTARDLVEIYSVTGALDRTLTLPLSSLEHTQVACLLEFNDEGGLRQLFTVSAPEPVSNIYSHTYHGTRWQRFWHIARAMDIVGYNAALYETVVKVREHVSGTEWLRDGRRTTILAFDLDDVPTTHLLSNVGSVKNADLDWTFTSADSRGNIVWVNPYAEEDIESIFQEVPYYRCTNQSGNIYGISFRMNTLVRVTENDLGNLTTGTEVIVDGSDFTGSSIVVQGRQLLIGARTRVVISSGVPTLSPETLTVDLGQLARYDFRETRRRILGGIYAPDSEEEEPESVSMTISRVEGVVTFGISALEVDMEVDPSGREYGFYFRAGTQSKRVGHHAKADDDGETLLPVRFRPTTTLYYPLTSSFVADLELQISPTGTVQITRNRGQAGISIRGSTALVPFGWAADIDVTPVASLGDFYVDSRWPSVVGVSADFLITGSCSVLGAVYLVGYTTTSEETWIYDLNENSHFAGVEAENQGYLLQLNGSTGAWEHTYVESGYDSYLPTHVQTNTTGSMVYVCATYEQDSETGMMITAWDSARKTVVWRRSWIVPLPATLAFSVSPSGQNVYVSLPCISSLQLDANLTVDVSGQYVVCLDGATGLHQWYRAVSHASHGEQVSLCSTDSHVYWTGATEPHNSLGIEGATFPVNIQQVNTNMLLVAQWSYQGVLGYTTVVEGVTLDLPPQTSVSPTNILYISLTSDSTTWVAHSADDDPFPMSVSATIRGLLLRYNASGHLTHLYTATSPAPLSGLSVHAARGNAYRALWCTVRTADASPASLDTLAITEHMTAVTTNFTSTSMTMVIQISANDDISMYFFTNVGPSSASDRRECFLSGDSRDNVVWSLNASNIAQYEAADEMLYSPLEFPYNHYYHALRDHLPTVSRIVKLTGNDLTAELTGQTGVITVHNQGSSFDGSTVRLGSQVTSLGQSRAFELQEGVWTPLSNHDVVEMSMGLPVLALAGGTTIVEDGVVVPGTDTPVSTPLTLRLRKRYDQTLQVDIVGSGLNLEVKTQDNNATYFLWFENGDRVMYQEDESQVASLRESKIPRRFWPLSTLIFDTMSNRRFNFLNVLPNGTIQFPLSVPTLANTTVDTAIDLPTAPTPGTITVDPEAPLPAAPSPSPGAPLDTVVELDTAGQWYIYVPPNETISLQLEMVGGGGAGGLGGMGGEVYVVYVTPSRVVTNVNWPAPQAPPVMTPPPDWLTALQLFFGGGIGFSGGTGSTSSWWREHHRTEHTSNLRASSLSLGVVGDIAGDTWDKVKKGATQVVSWVDTNAVQAADAVKAEAQKYVTALKTHITLDNIMTGILAVEQGLLDAPDLYTGLNTWAIGNLAAVVNEYVPPPMNVVIMITLGVALGMLTENYNFQIAMTRSIIHIGIMIAEGRSPKEIAVAAAFMTGTLVLAKALNQKEKFGIALVASVDKAFKGEKEWDEVFDDPVLTLGGKNPTARACTVAGLAMMRGRTDQEIKADIESALTNWFNEDGTNNDVRYLITQCVLTLTSNEPEKKRRRNPDDILWFAGDGMGKLLSEFLTASQDTDAIIAFLNLLMIKYARENPLLSTEGMRVYVEKVVLLIVPMLSTPQAAEVLAAFMMSDELTQCLKGGGGGGGGSSGQCGRFVRKDITLTAGTYLVIVGQGGDGGRSEDGIPLSTSGQATILYQLNPSDMTELVRAPGGNYGASGHDGQSGLTRGASGGGAGGHGANAPYPDSNPGAGGSAGMGRLGIPQNGSGGVGLSSIGVQYRAPDGSSQPSRRGYGGMGGDTFPGYLGYGNGGAGGVGSPSKYRGKTPGVSGGDGYMKITALTGGFGDTIKIWAVPES